MTTKEAYEMPLRPARRRQKHRAGGKVSAGRQAGAEAALQSAVGVSRPCAERAARLLVI